MSKPIDIRISIENHPKDGMTVTFNFSEKIRSFGLSDEKAEMFAHFILKKVEEIRDRAT